MRVSELSERSGVPLPTIKFYIREGLLPAGVSMGPTQAEYDERHLSRLALIRSLRDDAGLSVRSIARALSAADAARLDGEASGDFIAAAVDALERPGGAEVSESDEFFVSTKSDLIAFLRQRGWSIEQADRSLADAVRMLVIAHRAFPNNAIDDIAHYAEAAEVLARHEIPEHWAPGDAPDSALTYAVLGTVLFEPLILALRRLAHVSRTRVLTERAKQAEPRGEMAGDQCRKTVSDPALQKGKDAKRTKRAKASEKAGARSAPRSPERAGRTPKERTRATAKKAREPVDQRSLIYEAVAAIPRGAVATYGQVAELAGIPSGHRVVARAMRSCPDGLPWHRVVGKHDARRATVAIGEADHAALQRELLQREGVAFDRDGHIPLARSGWLPNDAARKRKTRK